MIIKSSKRLVIKAILASGIVAAGSHGYSLPLALRVDIRSHQPAPIGALSNDDSLEKRASMSHKPCNASRQLELRSKSSCLQTMIAVYTKHVAIREPA